MRMCKRQALSILITLALIVGCFAGTGISAKAAGMTGTDLLQATVADESGQPVSGVEFQIIATFKGSDDSIVETLESANGKIEYNVSMLENGMYRLYFNSEDYDVDKNYYEFSVQNGVISRVADWDDQSVDEITFTVTEQAESPKLSVITIKLVNSVC